MELDDEIFSIYREFADDFISDNFGINCKIFYPPKIVDCPNCIFDSKTGKSANIYQSGGPVPFSFGVCPYCHGEGKRNDESAADTIKLRCYFDKKSWVKISSNVVVEDGAVQIIGFIYDLPKIKRAEYLLLNSDLSDYIEYKYCVDGELLPHGFKRNRYFIGYLKRV